MYVWLKLICYVSAFFWVLLNGGNLSFAIGLVITLIICAKVSES